MSLPRARGVLAVALLLLSTPLLAVDPPPPPTPPTLLSDHKNWFLQPQIWNIQTDAPLSGSVPPNLKYKAFSAVGYNLANTIAIVGAAPSNEIIIIDTLGDFASAEKAIQAFRTAGAFPASGKLPIRAIIYTHNHIDHIGGVKAFLQEAQQPRCDTEIAANAGSDAPFTAPSNCVSIIGQENIVSGVNNTATVIGTMINTRSGYMYGSFLPPGWLVTNGIGYKVEEGQSGFVMPSHTFSNSMQFQAAGVNMEVVYVPSETNDELAVFIPDAQNGGSGKIGRASCRERG